MDTVKSKRLTDKKNLSFICIFVIITAATIIYSFYIISKRDVFGKVTPISDTGGSINLDDGSVISQVFTVPAGSFQGLRIFFNADYTNNKAGTITAALYNADGNNCGEWSFTKYDLSLNQTMLLMNTQTAEFTSDTSFRLEITGADSGCSIQTYSGSKTPYVISSGAEGENFSDASGSENVGSAVMCQVLEHIIPRPVVCFLTLLALLLVFTGFFFLWKKQLPLQFMFLYFSVITAVAAAFFVMPFQNMDEPVHFYRSYAVSLGDFYGHEGENNTWGSILPKEIHSYEQYFSVPDTRNQKLSIYDTAGSVTISSGETVFANDVSISVYAPTNYIFQAFGIFLTRLFTKNVLAIYYGGRLFYTAVLTLIFFAAIALTPCGKPLFFAFGTFATAIQFRSSYSSDGLVIALIVLLFAFVLKKASEPDGRMKKSSYVLMYTLLIFLSLAKSAYILSVLVLFLIPWKQFGTRKNYFRNILAAAALTSILFLGWTFLALPIQHVYQSSITWYVSSSDQIRYILMHPSAFFKMLLQYFDSGYILINSLGLTAAWNDLAIGCNITFLSCLLVIVSIFYENEKAAEISLSAAQRILLVFIYAATVLLLAAALYSTWSSVHLEHIKGLQARYFFPLLPLLCFAVRPKQPLKAGPVKELAFQGAALAGMCCTLVTMMAAVL